MFIYGQWINRWRLRCWEQIGLTIIRLNLLSVPETIRSWIDGRISCRHSAPTSFLVDLLIAFCGTSWQMFTVFVNRRRMAAQKINSVLFICLGMYGDVFCDVNSLPFFGTNICSAVISFVFIYAYICVHIVHVRWQEDSKHWSLSDVWRRRYPGFSAVLSTSLATTLHTHEWWPIAKRCLLQPTQSRCLFTCRTAQVVRAYSVSGSQNESMLHRTRLDENCSSRHIVLACTLLTCCPRVCAHPSQQSSSQANATQDRQLVTFPVMCVVTSATPESAWWDPSCPRRSAP